MIQVNELFRRLSYSELSNLSAGSNGSGVIKESHRANVIDFTNEALMRLHSRFILKENDVLIEQKEHLISYHLSSKFARSNPDPEPGFPIYIQDTEEDPFRNDVIKVLAVTDVNAEILPLNDIEQWHSVFTPQPTLLQVPHPVEGSPLMVYYQASHDPIGYEDYEACIDIPRTLERALRAYIAYQHYSGMNGQENILRAEKHLATYEAICMEVEANDLVNTSISTTNSKFRKGGWV